MMKELLRQIGTIIRDYRDAKKYRSQLLKAQLNVDAFEYFLRVSKVTGVEIEMDFGDNKKVTIRPEHNEVNMTYKSFRDKYKENKLNA